MTLLYSWEPRTLDNKNIISVETIGHDPNDFKTTNSLIYKIKQNFLTETFKNSQWFFHYFFRSLHLYQFYT